MSRTASLYGAGLPLYPWDRSELRLRRIGNLPRGA
jgi:hypothetical protein